MLSGIYYIINQLDRKRYIGFSSNIEARYAKINCDWTQHHNPKLARAAKKHGNENFRFVLVEECSEEMLSKQEIFHCSMFPKHMLYNIAEAGRGGNLGEEVNKKLSVAGLKRFVDEETRKQHSLNSNPWNRGLHNVQIGWNKGLTKETNKSLALVSQKVSAYAKTRIHKRDAFGRFVKKLNNNKEI